MNNTHAKSFVMIMMVIAVCALSLRFGIDKIIRFNISQNESNAQGTLKLISAALESYAKDNHGVYPTSTAILTEAKPPYLDKDYISQHPSKGYNFSCSKLESSGYSCNASPLRCKLTGTIAYTVTTGGLFVSEGCKVKD